MIPREMRFHHVDSNSANIRKTADFLERENARFIPVMSGFSGAIVTIDADFSHFDRSFYEREAKRRHDAHNLAHDYRRQLFQTRLKKGELFTLNFGWRRAFSRGFMRIFLTNAALDPENRDMHTRDRDDFKFYGNTWNKIRLRVLDSFGI